MSFTMTTHETKSQPFFVTILAGAISSVGYGVSVFAIGILWLLPSAVPALPAQVKSKKHKHQRRRSAPPVLPSSGIHRPPLSSLISSSSQPTPDSPRPSSTRRVYFADSPTLETPPSRRRTLPLEDLRESSLGSASVIPLDASPRSSSSTLVHISPPLPSTLSRIPDVILEPAPETARPPPSQPLLSMTPRLPSKIKDSWNRKVSGSKPSNQNTDSGGEATQSDEASRSAGPSNPLRFFMANPKNKGLTSNRYDVGVSSPRPSLSIPTDVPSSKPDSPCTSSAISSLVRSTKQQRRASAPIRERTQPYAYPYFATPPIAGDQQHTAASAASAASEEPFERSGSTAAKSLDLPRESADSERRRLNAAAQASLGLGPRRPQQTRTMSESFALAS
ncbi:hypothetical protein BT96DRAFT_1012704 [Gymnopus androsaceus JB14]|uniref:Uncharacterized protein n=1 Tax=Gymnopus androsaceus JB14 TaxID=1447944 RepID=A0A6A4IES3_9AGAR|nr:hypothetical protein BT96DRAFT_1012704 [Gymnopus androsaceus JB14]